MGAPRIHGELLKLGIDIGQTSVAKYMARRRGPPSQGWKTFLRNHADGVAAMDLFVVPTVSFRLLYGLLIMSHGRRQILWLGVTAQPTAEWIANQLTAACGWEQIPRDLIRDRDACYGSLFVRRVRSLGIRDHPTSVICFRSSNRQTLVRLRQAKLNHRHSERTKLQRLHRNPLRYRKTYRAHSDTWMMISLTDCFQRCLPSSVDAAKRFLRQIKVPARLWSRLLCLKGS